jgi:hypothetical protein
VRADAGVGAVGEDGDALAFANSDHLVGAGGGQVVGAARARQLTARRMSFNSLRLSIR